ncbi:MAG TPA: hypothetical protein VK577_15230, partial [Bradyrhizobium sp.]|nr:hypothetical protein [Bradyrhizobium sp.]
APRIAQSTTCATTRATATRRRRSFVIAAVGNRPIKEKSSFPDVQLHIVDAPLGAGPESILPIVVMDSGLARFTRAPE